MVTNQGTDQALQAQQKVKELIAEGERQRVRARLMRQFQEFELGNNSSLQQDEFVAKIPQLIEEFVGAGELARVGEMLRKLARIATAEDEVMRGRAAMALSFCSGWIIASGPYELIAQITLALAHWLKVETVYQPVCDTVCRQLQQGGRRMLDEGQWQQFESLLDILFQIQSGELQKNNVIRGLVAKTQDGLAADHILEELFLVSVHGQGARRVLAEKIITRLGRRSVVFLLEKLLQSQQKAERLRLIQLIPASGKIALPVLKEYISRELPWYGVRNIVLLIASLGDASHVPLVLPALDHEDMRVQQQAIDCIKELAGQEKKKYLMMALTRVNDELKVNLVTQLGQMGCAECMDALLDILAYRNNIAAHVRDDLLGQICIVLRITPQQRTVILLRQILEECEQKGGSSHDALRLIIRRTLQIVEPQLQSEKKAPAAEPVVSFGSDPDAEQRVRLDMRDVETKILKYLQEKKISELTAFIVEQAIQAARSQDFIKAEILRDRLLAVNPNALVEVIRVGEVIEEQQSTSISSHHLSIWSELYDFLDTDMFTALYGCQSFREYQPEESIVEQGAHQSTLFFINEGQAALTCRQGNKEIFLQRMGPGTIVGAAPFFDVTVWTVSVTAISSVKLQVLERAKYEELLEHYPGLDGQLSDFCRRSDKTADLLRISGENRRESVRYPTQHIVYSSFIDGQGNPSQQRFKGLLDDLSQTGLSLVIRISRQENARLLLGRHLFVSLPVDSDDNLECRGEIVGVSLQDFVEKDYQIHVRLEKSLSAIDFKNILSQWQK